MRGALPNLGGLTLFSEYTRLSGVQLRGSCLLGEGSSLLGDFNGLPPCLSYSLF